jgi:aryl-alcohol dehydrogenase-like predicted oxidoreductase
VSEEPGPEAQALLARAELIARRLVADEGEGAEEAALLSQSCLASQPPLPGRARSDGCRRFVENFGRHSRGFYGPAADLLVSALGIGTNRGADDDATDLAYVRAVRAALQGGVNLIDTAINYRRQRSERAVGAALRLFIAGHPGTREGVVVCSKGGFLVPGVDSPQALPADEVAGRSHCLHPAFLAEQINRSRRNLGLETIDVYLLHNPDFQLQFVTPAVLTRRLRAAFELLEGAVAEGSIGRYGIATWHGFRHGALSLRQLEATAVEVAGDGHHLRFLELPFNLGRREALTERREAGDTVLEVATELGIAVLASAALGRGRPDAVPPAHRGLATDAQRAIQAVRSTPGIAAALVGMRQVAHVAENLSVARVHPNRSR